MGGQHSSNNNKNNKINNSAVSLTTGCDNNKGTGGKRRFLLRRHRSTSSSWFGSGRTPETVLVSVEHSNCITHSRKNLSPTSKNNFDAQRIPVQMNSGGVAKDALHRGSTITSIETDAASAEAAAAALANAPPQCHCCCIHFLRQQLEEALQRESVNTNKRMSVAPVTRREQSGRGRHLRFISSGSLLSTTRMGGGWPFPTLPQCCLGARTQLSQFSLVCEIGRGAFGKVYAVIHRTMQKRFALKFMSKKCLVQKSMTTNVLRELELLQELNHPFIAGLWFTFQDDEYIFMISDLLGGGDLRHHLNAQGRFSESRAKLYICEIALALDYLHARRIVHRDVKPENILLDAAGHAVLADLNLAVRLGDDGSELVTSFTGTRFYMAPEVLSTALSLSPGYDNRVDWWSLGITFFEMLRGRRPFDFPSSFSSLQVLHLITGNLGVPPHWSTDLRAFIGALLRVEPRRRISDLRQFHGHQYMQRINLEHVLFRKTAPMFIPGDRSATGGESSNYHHHYHNYLSGSRAGITAGRLFHDGGDYNPLPSDERRRLNSSPLNLRLRRHRYQRTPTAPMVMNAAGGGLPVSSSPPPSAALRKGSLPPNEKPSIGVSASRRPSRWTAEIAHLTLSFRDYNRFRAGGHQHNGEMDQLEALRSWQTTSDSGRTTMNDRNLKALGGGGDFAWSATAAGERKRFTAADGHSPMLQDSRLSMVDADGGFSGGLFTTAVAHDQLLRQLPAELRRFPNAPIGAQPPRMYCGHWTSRALTRGIANATERSADTNLANGTSARVSATFPASTRYGSAAVGRERAAVTHHHQTIVTTVRFVEDEKKLAEEALLLHHSAATTDGGAALKDHTNYEKTNFTRRLSLANGKEEKPPATKCRIDANNNDSARRKRESFRNKCGEPYAFSL